MYNRSMQVTIYLATNLVTNKRYVGQTVQPFLTRWKRHLSDALGTKRRPHPLHEAIRKYGRDAWRIEAIEVVDSYERSNDREAALIVDLLTLHPHGYNMKPGGGSAGHHPETRARLAAAQRGKKLPPEVIAKLRATHRVRVQTPAQLAGLALGLARSRAIAGKPGKKHTAESRAKMSAAGAGKPKSAAHRAAIGAAHVGMKRSEETRRRISEAGLRRGPVSDETRRKLSTAL